MKPRTVLIIAALLALSWSATSCTPLSPAGQQAALSIAQQAAAAALAEYAAHLPVRAEK